MNTRTLCLALVLASAGIAPASTLAAESYDNCTGFIDSVPAVIATQGVWCLRADLSTAITTGAAITVATNNVTIECNDFKLGGLAAGPESEAFGIRAQNRQNVTVRGCGIRGFSRGMAIFGETAGGHLVERNRLDGNLQAGIIVSGNGSSTVRHNRVMDTGGDVTANFVQGIVASGNVIDNTVDGIFAASASAQVIGINHASVQSGLVVSGNRVRSLSLSSAGIIVGILAESPYVQVLDNQVVTNTNNIGHYGIMTSNENPNMVGGNRVSGFATPYFGQSTAAGANYSN